MSKWPGCPVIACMNDLCHDGCQYLKKESQTMTMPDIVQRLRSRLVWDYRMQQDAAFEIERLRAALEAVDSEIVLTGQLKELVDAAHEQNVNGEVAK